MGGPYMAPPPLPGWRRRSHDGPGVGPTQKRLQDAIEALSRLESGDIPSSKELATAPILEGWHLTEHHHFLALGGFVTGHPSLPDGAYILTSPLLWLADDRHVARTVSRFYRLGTASEESQQIRH